MTRPQANALVELRAKTIQQIQMETAYTWAYRAWAAKELMFEHDYTSYADEAVEHAALTGDDEVLKNVRNIIAQGEA